MTEIRSRKSDLRLVAQAGAQQGTARWNWGRTSFRMIEIGDVARRFVQSYTR